MRKSVENKMALSEVSIVWTFCQQHRANARLSEPMERFMCRRGSNAAGRRPSSSSGRPLCRNSWLMSTGGGEWKAGMGK